MDVASARSVGVLENEVLISAVASAAGSNGKHADNIGRRRDRPASFLGPPAVRGGSVDVHPGLERRGEGGQESHGDRDGEIAPAPNGGGRAGVNTALMIRQRAGGAQGGGGRCDPVVPDQKELIARVVHQATGSSVGSVCLRKPHLGRRACWSGRVRELERESLGRSAAAGGADRDGLQGSAALRERETLSPDTHGGCSRDASRVRRRGVFDPGAANGRRGRSNRQPEGIADGGPRASYSGSKGCDEKGIVAASWGQSCTRGAQAVLTDRLGDWHRHRHSDMGAAPRVP